VKSNTTAEIVCRLLIVAIIVFSAAFLPLVRWGNIGSFVNLFWGMLYGLGWFVAGFFAGNVRSVAAVVFGMIMWPIGLSVILYVLSGVIWHTASTPQLVFGIGTFVSLLCVISLDQAHQPPFDRLPLFTHFMFLLY
jgi:hypothetical protein